MALIDVFALVDAYAKELGVCPDLARAITTVESGGSAVVVRYEPKWFRFRTPEVFAPMNGITLETERVLQAMSWGPMQTMGTVCRELGYKGPLVALTNPSIVLRYSIMKLKALADKYEDEAFAISAYNCGTPKKGPDGTFSNQTYVDRVQARLKVLRQIG